MKKIVLTGGHAATTATAVVQEIISEKKGWEIFWIGALSAFEGKNVSSLESQILPELGVKFLPITTGRLQRKFTVYTIPSILKIPFGFLQALLYIVKVRPALVLSFGGYSAFPVVVAAKIFGIPIVLHEQTAVYGRANILAAAFATRIALARESSLEFFPKEKCTVTGNPVMAEITKIGVKEEVSHPPAIYITGGSRGSQSINETVGKALVELTAKYKLYHQTGELDYGKFKKLKERMPGSLSINYSPFSRVDPLGVAAIYEKADVVISRAGANTVSEIVVAKRPAILIPLPISYMDEQTRNAEFAVDFGIAKIITQKDLTPGILIKALDEMLLTRAAIIRKVAKKKSPDVKAAGSLVKILSKLL